MKNEPITVQGSEVVYDQPPGGYLEMRTRVSAERPRTPEELAATVAQRKRLGLSLRVPIPLADGRMLVMQSATGKTMVCRQVAKGADLEVGDVVAMVADTDGSQIRLEVKKRRNGSGRKVLFDLLVLGRFVAAP